ncbi:MAG: hypothetical protein IJI66_01800 [Erysipelotrichaceae bacterium]|nr:hypothetical protein [Erysipelotrichaceae bacterium]
MYENFLNEYKTLELNVKDLVGLNVFEYENTLVTDDREKLKLCRIIRNYLQHHVDSDEFISISKGMVDFLHDLNIEFEKEHKHVTDRMKKIKAVGKDSTLQEAALLLTKHEYIPILDEAKKVIAVLDKNMLTEFISSGNRPTSKIRSLIRSYDRMFEKSVTGYCFARPEERLALYNKKDRIIIVDAKDIYKGIVVW